jgi:hypothetical protein
MRTLIPYTAARILMFGIAVMILYWAGARGILLLGLGLVISALASYILLNKQRQILADRLNSGLSGVGRKATEFRERLEEGAAAEDEDDDEDVAPAATSATVETAAAAQEAVPADQSARK